jgi:hypothetical protein
MKDILLYETKTHYSLIPDCFKKKGICNNFAIKSLFNIVEIGEDDA